MEIDIVSCETVSLNLPDDGYWGVAETQRRERPMTRLDVSRKPV